jgi:hypothetical protein
LRGCENRWIEPRRERTIFEAASVVFGSVIAAFGAWGAIETLASGEGAGSAAFVVSVAFVLLGSGRVYLGLRPGR